MIRAVYQKYAHPKECFINNAMICPVLLETNLSGDVENLNLLFAQGCSMNVVKPALPLIASGSTSYPHGRPLGAIYYSKETRGRLVVYGGGHSFTDK